MGRVNLRDLRLPARHHAFQQGVGGLLHHGAVRLQDLLLQDFHLRLAHGLLERGLPHLHRTFNRALALVGFALRLAAFGGCATGGFTLSIGFTALAHILDLSFSRRIWVIVTSPRRKGAPRRVFAPGSVNQIESTTEDLVRK